MSDFRLVKLADPLNITLKQSIFTGGIAWRGDWLNTTNYIDGDGVSHNGSSYVCTAENTGQEPPNNSYWQLIAEEGAQGSTGTQGGTGIGTQGPTGADSTVQGPSGGQGASGAQGATGAGIQGATGADGSQGPTGTGGSQGPSGAGSQGPSGAGGSQGATGSQGSTAAQGSAGAQGPSGTSQGATGTQGGTGGQGATGAQGDTGGQGASGAGSQGGTGAQGPSGTSQGASGTQGGTGAQGATGSGASPTELLATNQSANYNGGSAYTVLTAPSTGLYRVTVYTIVTTADGASSTLPSNTIGWTDPGNVAQTWAATIANSGNSTTTWEANTVLIHAKTGTAITLTQAGYASGTPGAMKFTIAVAVEQL